MKNIAEILKDCPENIALYSPIFGNVKLREVIENVNDTEIVVTLDNGDLEFFNRDGTYYKNGEVMLFPSNGNRDWNNFSSSKLQFQAGEPVLTEYYNNGYYWKCNIYSHYDPKNGIHVCIYGKFIDSQIHKYDESLVGKPTK